MGDLHRPARACFLEIGGDFCIPLPTSRRTRRFSIGPRLMRAGDAEAHETKQPHAIKITAEVACFGDKVLAKSINCSL